MDELIKNIIGKMGVTGIGVAAMVVGGVTAMVIPPVGIAIAGAGALMVGAGVAKKAVKYFRTKNSNKSEIITENRDGDRNRTKDRTKDQSQQQKQEKTQEGIDTKQPNATLPNKVQEVQSKIEKTSNNTGKSVGVLISGIICTAAGVALSLGGVTAVVGVPLAAAGVGMIAGGTSATAYFQGVMSRLKGEKKEVIQQQQQQQSPNLSLSKEKNKTQDKQQEQTTSTVNKLRAKQPQMSAANSVKVPHTPATSKKRGTQMQK